MRTIAALLLVAGLIASPQFLPARAAHACYCSIPRMEARVARSEVVALGTIVQIGRDARRLVTVDVDEYLKGAGPDRFHVRDVPGGSCSAFMTRGPVGQQFLLFLTTDEEGQLRTSFCEGSGRVEDGEQGREDLAEIRQIVSEQEQPSDPPTLTATPSEPQLPAAGSGSKDDSVLPIAVAVAGAAFALGAGLLLGVRRLRSG